MKRNFLKDSFLHFSLEIRTLIEEIIVERMRKTKEKFSPVDEVPSPKFLKIITRLSTL